MLSGFSTTQGQVMVREAAPEDAAQLLELRLESLRLHPKAFAADITQTAEGGMKDLEKRISENKLAGNGTVMIAIARDELEGMTGILRGHWPKTRHAATLWGVYVRPGWRGMRLGEAMINQCLEWGQRNQVTVVYLAVTTSEIPAIRCYARCGFTEYAVEPRSLFYDGRYYDQMLMVKVFE